jgi:M6 family metalloprotease-like protein
LPPAVAALAPSLAVRRRPTTGKMACLVLLVDFKDNPGSRTPADFQEMLFSEKAYPTGSMRDFYRENSYGELDLQGQVVGWLRLPKPYAEYVNGESGTGPNSYPKNAQKMVEDALALAAAQVDFRDFDKDGDGFLDGLFVVHAGGGAEADPTRDGRANKVWSHQWNIPQEYTSNGVKAYAYCTEPEDGKVGVFCHEFGHMLGLPDLYDTTYHDSQHNNDHPGSYWVALCQADGKQDLELGRNRGDKGDPFPGSKKNTRFDDDTNPGANDRLDNATGVAVTDVAVNRQGEVTCNVKV